MNKWLFIFISLVLFNCAKPKSPFVNELELNGENITHQSSGLIVTYMDDLNKIRVTSTYGVFMIMLPNANWKFTISSTYPLFASSDSGTLSIVYDDQDFNILTLQNNLMKSPMGPKTQFKLVKHNDFELLITSNKLNDLIQHLKGNEFRVSDSLIQNSIYIIKPRRDGSTATYHYSTINHGVWTAEQEATRIQFATDHFSANSR